MKNKHCTIKDYVTKLIVTINFYFIQGFYSKNVTLNIYYESLCPDSIDFITKQLYPTWKNLGKYIIPVFKPSGKESVSKM